MPYVRTYVLHSDVLEVGCASLVYFFLPSNPLTPPLRGKVLSLSND